MFYKPFCDKQISVLGLGCMRLPVEAGSGKIDVPEAEKLIAHAYQSGINYFDTAYGYHGGQSEIVTGKALSQFPRDTWYIASKMPGHMMNYKDGKLSFHGYMTGSTMPSTAAIFEHQLEKCGVDYFDFYLLHNLAETSYAFYTDEDLRITEYLLEQKRKGRIRHLGFSAHGRPETIEAFLKAYDCFEFAQIQINYLDWVIQDAKQKYEILTRHKLPVIAMEPVRGGALAALDASAQALLRAARPEDPDVYWALRFLQSLDNMQVILSGMSSMAQLEQNLALFSKPSPTDAAENALLMQVVEGMMNRVPCTACRYCCDDCPKGLDIPKLLSLYNELSYGAAGTMQFTLGAMTQEELPSACIACGKCKTMCPQSIDIPEVLAKFAEKLAQKG